MHSVVAECLCSLASLLQQGSFNGTTRSSLLSTVEPRFRLTTSARSGCTFVQWMVAKDLGWFHWAISAKPSHKTWNTAFLVYNWESGIFTWSGITCQVRWKYFSNDLDFVKWDCIASLRHDISKLGASTENQEQADWAVPTLCSECNLGWKQSSIHSQVASRNSHSRWWQPLVISGCNHQLLVARYVWIAHESSIEDVHGKHPLNFLSQAGTWFVYWAQHLISLEINVNM